MKCENHNPNNYKVDPIDLFEISPLRRGDISHCAPYNLHCTGTLWETTQLSLSSWFT